MTIDPKAAELAKALADAVAAQQTPGYEELSKAAEEKALIDKRAEQAAWNLREHYAPKVGCGIGLNTDHTLNGPRTGETWTPRDDHDIFAVEPERYELPEDETATAKPNGGYLD
jgi:hypothetical protein